MLGKLFSKLKTGSSENSTTTVTTKTIEQEVTNPIPLEYQLALAREQMAGEKLKSFSDSSLSNVIPTDMDEAELQQYYDENGIAAAAEPSKYNYIYHTGD
jgi:hypothetical protein